MDVGQHVGGRYRVVAGLSAGTCGRVLQATDTRDGGSVWLHALDLVPGPQERARLDALVRRTRDCAGVLRVREVVVGQDGLALVLELPPSAEPIETVADLTRRHGAALPRPLAERVVRALFAAIAALHEGGVVHGAVAPRNVVWDGASCFLLGAGLAAVNGPKEGLGVPQRGAISFMAPELLERGPATPASDVFSVGVVGYQLISGRIPGQGKDALATIEQRAKHAAPPLSTVAEDVGAEVDGFFAKALALTPEARFHDGREAWRAWVGQPRARATPAGKDDAARAELSSATAQRAVLDAASAWLAQGGALLPTDVVLALAAELADRVDRQIVAAAWEDDELEPRSRIFLGDADGGVVDSVDVLAPARDDLRALSADERRDVLAMLARVSVDHAPRGVEGVGDERAHVRVRVGPLRILYCIRGGLVVLTRVMRGLDPAAGPVAEAADRGEPPVSA